MEGKCVVFANHKGGTGKTTSCVNLAGELARNNRNVLVVDSDPQGNATSALGLDGEEIDACMYDVLLSGCTGDEKTLLEDVILTTEVKNLDIAPATLDLSGILTQIHKADNPFTVLRDSMDGIRGFYDFVLVDTPPSYGYFLINSVYAADRIILPLDTGAFTMESIRDFTTLLGDIEKELSSDINIHAVTLTVPQDSLSYRFSRMLSNLISSYRHPSLDVKDNVQIFLSINKSFGENLHVIPYSPEIYNAQSAGLPLCYYNPGHGINRIYKEISSGLLDGT
ncbi:MAG: hypothetical protein B6U72_03320 [Candidatus Altiarchaeales archaeon ex4484_2]|nr:MAG: hypothetical protein B6U72_03320 [Candidatus Altiarchaeales archaeon ex4484_2]